MGLQTELSPTILMSVGLILDCLKHLRTVILSEALYLNSVQLKRESIRRCCEQFWCDYEPLSDNKIEIKRMKFTMEFVDQVERVTKANQNVRIWVDLDKKLRSILPDSKNTQQNPNASSSWSLLFDPKIITLSLIEVLIVLCESIRSLKIKLAIHGAIINEIHRSFVRPLNLLLWSHAKREGLE